MFFREVLEAEQEAMVFKAESSTGMGCDSKAVGNAPNSGIYQCDTRYAVIQSDTGTCRNPKYIKAAMNCRTPKIQSGARLAVLKKVGATRTPDGEHTLENSFLH